MIHKGKNYLKLFLKKNLINDNKKKYLISILFIDIIYCQHLIITFQKLL